MKKMTENELYNMLAAEPLHLNLASHRKPECLFGVVVDVTTTELRYYIKPRDWGDTQIFGDIKEAIAAFVAIAFPPSLPPHIAPSIRSQSRRPDDDETTEATTA